MRVVIHSYVYYPEQFLINELSEGLVKCGHQVQVYTGLPNYPKGDFHKGYSLLGGPYRETWKNHEIVRYPVTPRKKGFKLLAINYLSNLFFGTLCLARLKKADVHFVFATSPITTAIPAILKARLTGAKVCLWLQDLWPESVTAVGATGQRSILQRILGRVVRWIYKRVDLVMIQSPGFRDNLNRYGYEGPIVNVPNWAPSIEKNDSNMPDWLMDFPEDDFTVTFAGNIGKAQAVLTVLDSAYELKDTPGIRFVFVGDGSAKNEAQVYVAERQMANVLFFGRRPTEDMPHLFEKSSALLVSLSDDPIFSLTIPSKLQAYMSASKPILGSLSGVGADLILDSGGGLVSPALDASGLTQNVLKLRALSVQERAEMGARSRSYFEKNFTKEKVIAHIEAQVRELSQ